MLEDSKTTYRERDPNCPFVPYGCHKHGLNGCVEYLDPEEFARVVGIISNSAPPTAALKRLFATYRRNQERARAK